MAKTIDEQMADLIYRKGKLQQSRDVAIMNGNFARANSLFPKIQTLCDKMRRLHVKSKS